MEKNISLYYKEGASDKEYHVQLIQEGGAFVVNFQYGRRGGALKGGTKTLKPVQLPEAEKIYNKVVNEKLREGYTEGDAGTGVVTPGPTSKEHSKIGEVSVLPQLLNFVADPQVYINDEEWVAQEKMDGDRRLLSSDIEPGNVLGLNRKGQKVILPTPIVKSVNSKYTIDGEIIGDKIYAFDLLSLEGKDTRNLKCVERITLLNSDLKFGNGIIVVRTAYTKEEKQALYEELISRNAEGIVFKKKHGLYKAGRPNSGGDQVKYKFYKEGTFIVKDYTAGKRSIGLELIGEDGATRIPVGKVTIPPNKDIPSIGDLVEVRYLYAYKGGSIFQPVYLSNRDDLYIDDANVSQLIYKAD